MSNGVIERRILRNVASVLCKQLADQAIEDLEALPATLSGEDSGLADVWEELCVQVQTEQSFYWDTYLTMLDETIEARVSALPKPFQDALSAATEDGDDWLDEPNGRSIPLFTTAMGALVREQGMELAGDYESASIERYKSASYRD